MVSIVTALYNRLDLTSKFFASLEANPPHGPWEIIWVDDGSTDGTREWLRSLGGGQNRVILNESNRGYAYNNNLAARAALGDTLVLLNNDLVLTPNWFEPMARALSKHSLIGVVGNVQLQPATGLIDHAGIIFNLAGLPEHHLRGRRQNTLCSEGAFQRGATAACCMLRRSVFLEAGGFDERYKNGGEDVALCLSLADLGLRHWICYESRVWHHVSSSPGRHTAEDSNLALFLKEWKHLTIPWGREDWPAFYLSRHRHELRRLNFIKTIDALARLAGLRRGDSAWAAKRRNALLASLNPQA